MPAVMPISLMDLARHNGPDDFKARVKNKLKSTLSGFQITDRDILVATFIQSEVTKGGIIKPNKSVAEDLYQGKVGLVLQLGPLAFKYDRYGHEWEGVKFGVDDWVVFRFADAWNIHLNEVDCKAVDFENVRAVVDDPTKVF